MRNKEDMDCFKWYKNDRICYLCPYEEECKYEYNLYDFTRTIWCHCKHREIFHDDYFSPCKNPNFEGKYCSGRGKFEHDIVFECKSKEIENWKRKYKLNKLND